MANAPGLAPMAPTSPPSSRTSESSTNATLIERVQTPPIQTQPKFVFGAGSSSSPFDFDSPLGSTSVYRHSKYYMDPDMVVFQVGGHVRRYWQVALTWPLFRSTVACTAYTSTSSSQRLGFSGICLPFRYLIMKWRRAPRKGQQTTPQSPSRTLLARSLKLSSISSTIGSYRHTVATLDSHRDTSERARRRRRNPSTNGFPFSPSRLVFSSIGSVDERSAR